VGGGASELLVLEIFDVISEDSLLSGGGANDVVVSTVDGAVFLRRGNMVILGFCRRDIDIRTIPGEKPGCESRY